MHFRCPASLVSRLDALAEERGIGRSRLVRQLLEVGLQDRPSPPCEPLSEAELLSVLNEKTRNGHVAAARALLARLEEQNPRERMLREFHRMAQEARSRNS
jgi:Ribbon-helix-helix protein, copG family